MRKLWLALALLALSPVIPGSAPASHVRPEGATPVYLSLVPAYQRCASPNTTHGAPLGSQSCAPAAQSSNYLTFGTPDANGAPANARGHIRLDVVLDPADVVVELELGDVRCRPATNAGVCPSPNAQDGPDYTGGLLAQFIHQETDHYNGTTLTDSATMLEIPFPIPATCAATASTRAGSLCTTKTSFNAEIPGTIKDGQRDVWEFQQVYVYDGGADGDNRTAGDTTFAIQGVFVP